MHFGIVVFPGSNCDHDCYWGLKKGLGFQVSFLWHRQRDLDGVNCIVLPGGFAHGDYLRAGAIARFSPIMDAVVEHAEKGRPVVGICNGFQVLTEIGLLPGALLRNDSLRFIHRPVSMRVEHSDSAFTAKYQSGSVIQLPIAHGQGKYYAPIQIMDELEASHRVLFRYSGPQGQLDPEWNPNGSVNHIAGICNERGNVMGMMPHPERRLDPKLGRTDGKEMFLAVAEAFS